MKRALWITFGGLTQVAFAVMVPNLFLWLYRGSGDPLGLGTSPPSPGTLALGWAVAVDLALLLQFALPHSLLLLPGVRDRVERFVPSPLYGSLFALVATGNVLLCVWLWQPLPGVVYATTGWSSWLLVAAFLGSWVLLIYSISLTGLGWQTGLTPWLCYARDRPVPRRRFVTGDLYGWLRHPIYLGFLGLIWFTPRLTSDHLLRAVVWSGYVYVGSVLKDRRLLFFLGARYQVYMERVRGYPLIYWGPLARSRSAATKGPAA